jgi:DNA invertase Pin-like site-specific DNA recombinase
LKETKERKHSDIVEMTTKIVNVLIQGSANLLAKELNMYITTIKKILEPNLYINLENLYYNFSTSLNYGYSE